MPDDNAPNHVSLDLPERILENVPDVPCELLRTTPYIIGGEGPEELKKIEEGRCLVCDSELGEETAVFCDGNGILYVVCNPICLDDMVIFGWLSEKAKDLMETVKFRGAANNGGNGSSGGGADEEEESEEP